jgi:hypothetical protein
MVIIFPLFFRHIFCIISAQQLRSTDAHRDALDLIQDYINEQNVEDRNRQKLIEQQNRNFEANMRRLQLNPQQVLHGSGANQQPPGNAAGFIGM